MTHCNMCASTESFVLCTTQRLRGQVSSLKASRDKLLVEVDRQSLEIERLLTDNSALEQVPKPPAYYCQAWTFALEVWTLQASACCELQQRPEAACLQRLPWLFCQFRQAIIPVYV